MNITRSCSNDTAMVLAYLLLFTVNGSLITLASSLSTVLLLSDIPTPAFIVDLTSSLDQRPPSLLLSQHGVTLFPTVKSSNVAADNLAVDYDCLSLDLGKQQEESGGGSSLPFFLHSTVVRAKEDFVEDRDESRATFLAEIDLIPSLAGYKRLTPNKNTNNDSNDNFMNQEPPDSDSAAATLCLGLNNHHVGGYYWARSAGSGASMEAPGVYYGETDFFRDDMFDNKGILQWNTEGGATTSNSNDGKRSEWVNFLRVGDTVQLVPSSPQDSLLEFVKKFDFYGEGGKCVRVYGINFEGRPMGSEPVVVCEWRCG